MPDLFGQANKSTSVIFYELFSNPAFSAAMTRNIFQILIFRLSLHNHTARFICWQHDKFETFREI